MSSTRLVSEELVSSAQLPTSHPMDSSRVMIELMRLSRKSAESAEEGDLDPLGGLVSRAALRTLLAALHYRDAATMQHSRRVAQLAVGMAEYLGWEGRHLRLLEVAALLHDIGKIGIPDNVLHKPGPLSHEETELISVHHNIAVDVLQACRVDKEVLDVLGQCYDLYAGANVGERRVAGNVHQGARILTVADAYDSIARDQSHRRGRRHHEVITELKAGAGSQFDGNVVSALERWVDASGLPFDDRAADIDASAPLRSADDVLGAHQLCHVFSYLYLLESMYDGFYIVDSDLRCVVWSRGAEKLLGHAARLVLGRPWSSRMLAYADGERPLPDSECPLRRVLDNGEHHCRKVRLQREDGQWCDVEVQAFPLTDASGQVLGVAEIFRDASRAGRKPREYRELKLAASRDALTQLANRGELETQLTVLVNEYEKSAEADPFSAIFLDVDFFKSINDTHGHNVGDDVLVDLGRLLRGELYSGELVARYGGEEFVVLCPSTDLDQAMQRAERLRVVLAKTDVGGVRVTASFGCAQMEQGDSVESVLRRADKALYLAKESGRNRTCSLTPEELRNGSRIERPRDDDAANPFVRRATFRAVVAADMVIYKLGGFVTDMEARIVEVRPEKTVINLGRPTFFCFWGDNDATRPVKLTIEMQSKTDTRRPTRGGQSIEVTARITPLGWIRNSEVFQARARRVLNSLRSYFVVND